MFVRFLFQVISVIGFENVMVNERVAHEGVLEKAHPAMHQKAVKDPFKE